ncbi:MAG: histidinol dehydrogenase [Actinomycetota bacterium]|nr:histidinol dehydrogenase [Actinomycetota bacterium]
MLARTDLRGFSGPFEPLLAAGTRGDDPDVAGAVREIIAAVRDRGDAALRDLTERFDGCRIQNIRVPHEACAAALDRIDPDLVLALEFARDQILAWHEAQRTNEARHERSGISVRELIVPVGRAGCYVPGGRAVYPSSVLMTAVPARVAGVPEVALCVPPADGGLVPDATLAAAAIAGVDEVYRVGGAQAIAALAYGTESIAPVDVIVGPGNQFVTEAKRQVFGHVGIDALAGPSDVAIIADDSVDPELVAADLLAQAEHGPGGGAVVISWHESVLAQVDRALEQLVVNTPRRGDAEATLTLGGRAFLVDGPDAAIDVANAIAPEHLQLMCENADMLVLSVRNAGAVFVGSDSPAVLGDYAAGVNHVLPTGGAARFASALQVSSFQKRVHVVTADADALARVAPYVTLLADTEGLAAHAASIRLRESRRKP